MSPQPGALRPSCATSHLAGHDASASGTDCVPVVAHCCRGGWWTQGGWRRWVSGSLVRLKKRCKHYCSVRVRNWRNDVYEDTGGSRFEGLSVNRVQLASPRRSATVAKKSTRHVSSCLLPLPSWLKCIRWTSNTVEMLHHETRYIKLQRIGNKVFVLLPLRKQNTLKLFI